MVLETGSPATMPWADKAAGVVEAWYPGIRGAEALANILTGKVNPSGKLAITFPKSDSDLPHPKLILPPPESEMRFDAGGDISAIMARAAHGMPAFQTTYDEKLEVGYKYYDAEKKPVLYPFGFGLSYTTYAYSGLSVKPGDGGALTVSFTVKNTGKTAGTEIAQVYTGVPDAAGEPPIVPADGRALARALRVAGKIEPVFVDNIADMPQAILDVARDGDVVITMGAGSIGGVPGKLVQN